MVCCESRRIEYSGAKAPADGDTASRQLMEALTGRQDDNSRLGTAPRPCTCFAAELNQG